MARSRGEVIVGVHDSLTGLRTLREAVATARRRGQGLRTVRAYPKPRLQSASEILFPTSPHYQYERAAQGRERRRLAAEHLVEKAFAEAMGGIPPDVPVRTEVIVAATRAALVEAVGREDDLLVVGATHRRWWWPVRRSVGAHCARRAACPVLVVPPHPAARNLRGSRLGRRLRARRELAGLVVDRARLT